MNRYLSCPKSSFMFLSLVKVRPCLFICHHFEGFFCFRKSFPLAMCRKKMGRKVGCKNELMLNWGWCSPSQGIRKMLLVPLRNDKEIILAFNHTGGHFTSLPSFLQVTHRVCQSPSLTLLCLEVDSRIWGKIGRQELLFHSPDGLFTPPAPPSGLLAQVSASFVFS